MVIILADWRLPVVLYIVLAFGLVRWMGKKYIVGDKRTKRLFLQFLVCFLVAFVLSVSQGQVALVFGTTAIVWVVGLMNGVACFYSWKAQDISLGRSSVFTIGDDIISMSLSYFILNEARYINIWSGSGIALAIIALLLFVNHAYRAKIRGESELPLQGLLYIGVYSVLWGVAIFAERYFSANEVPVAPFALAWYGGSLVAAFLIRVFVHEKDTRQMGDLTFRDKVITAVYSMLIISCLGLVYWSFKSPQIIVQPIYFVAEAIVPTIIAFVFFSERAQFDAAEYVYLGVAIAGVLLIFRGYTV